MSEENKLTGPWKETADSLKKVNTTIKGVLGRTTSKNLQILQTALVQHLQNQDLGWKGLNLIYKKWKEKNKLSNQILIATATMMNSITTQVIEGGLEGFVGILRTAPGRKRPGAKKMPKPVMLAAVHEYGVGVPKRPLFAQTLKEKQEEIGKNYTDAISKAIDSLGIGNGRK